MSETIRIPLTQGQFALIDAADLPLIAPHSWHAIKKPNGRWYARCQAMINGKRSPLPMHRLITDAPAGAEVDHKNGDTLDNRRANLCVTDRSGNARNLARATSRSTTGVLNVYRKGRRFAVGLYLDGRQRNLGTYATLPEAASAAYKARLLHYGPEAVARIPAPGGAA